MKQLFPIYPPAAVPETAQLALYTDVQWDPDAGTPVFSGGEPVIVSGREAVSSWAWRAIQTARYQWSVFSWDYGCELEALVGQPYSADTKLAEATRYVREALLVSPYITDVQVEDAAFDGSTLHLTCQFTSIYGKGVVYV